MENIPFIRVSPHVTSSRSRGSFSRNDRTLHSFWSQYNEKNECCGYYTAAAAESHPLLYSNENNENVAARKNQGATVEMPKSTMMIEALPYQYQQVC